MYKKLLNALMFSLLALVLSFGVSYVSAWTAPTQAPPLGNTPPPINTSATTQSKAGVLSVGGLTLPSGGIIDSGGAYASYGAATVRGTKNGWGGINFRDSSNNNLGTLMMRSGYSGFYGSADNNWRWYADESGNTWQPGYVQANDVYAGGRWMSSIVSDTGTVCPSGTNLVLCMYYQRRSPTYGWYIVDSCAGIGSSVGAALDDDTGYKDQYISVGIYCR